MGLIGAGGFLQLCQSYRLIWIGGRFGGGKTSFSFRLAQEFLEQGYRLITNTQSIWSDKWSDVQLDPDGMLHAVVIMDEAGLGLKANKQVEAMAAYANKMDIIYFFPSFFPPIRAAQVVTIQPVFGFINIGIPLIVYKWRVRIGSFEDKGFFAWLNPAEIWGIYSRRSPESNIYNLVGYLAERVEDYRKFFGVSDGVSTLEEPTEVDTLRDAATAMETAADAFASLPARGNRRRGL